MTKMDHNQMAGKTGTTRHGERVVYVGPAMDPARVRVRPLTPGADVFAPHIEHVSWDEDRDPRGPADREDPRNEAPRLMPAPEGVVPGELSTIVGGYVTMEVDEDGCVEDPENPGGTPCAYVVSREWFLSMRALEADLDAGARELRMAPYDGPPRVAPGTLVKVLHPFSGKPLGTGVVLGHEVGMYDHGSPESGPGPVEDTDLMRVLMVEGAGNTQAGRQRLVLDSDLEPLDDQKSGVDVGRGLTRREQRHCEFIRDTLIPDLRESGSDATADDFADLLNIVSDLASAPE